MPQHGIRWASRPANNAGSEMFGLRVGKVAAVNWQDHTVDLIGEDQSYLAHVPMATVMAGTDFGEIHLPSFDPVRPQDAPFAGGDGTGRPGGTRDVFAVFGFIRGDQTNPIVLGFLYPEVSQMMLEGYQKIIRHAGDTFQAVSMDGDIWLAYNSDGSFVGFHDDNPSPPILHGIDYDRLSNPAVGKKHSFTAVLRDGTSFHMDGPTGNIIQVAGQHIHQEAKGQLDLLGKVITLQGLPAIYPGGVTAMTVAPSTDDATISVAHLTTNAAYNYTPPIAGQGSAGNGILTGWTFLMPGLAARVEIPPDGKPRAWKSTASGFVGDPIAWEEVPFGGGISEYIVPPDQPYTLSFATLGNQTTPNWVAPFALTFNARQEINGASGTLTLQKNNSNVTNKPDSTHPLAIVAGDKLRVVSASTTDNTVEFCLTIVANPSTLPDTDLWFTVDPSTIPPTVTPPV